MTVIKWVLIEVQKIKYPQTNNYENMYQFTILLFVLRIYILPNLYNNALFSRMKKLYY